ncbi:hypothetical protein H5410_022900 [Solanum commersonii]|uniref:Uncharacterized protein n=1 Tax=Solanum commersonii TaxID=4109 RepID=A0A9J5ZFC6_SOLCO|nr:hypothetical protein H5410_022900 [Solanum commersonii]
MSQEALISGRFASTLNNVEKFNARNFRLWSIRMRYYFFSKKISSIIGGSDTTPPTYIDATKEWKVKLERLCILLISDLGNIIIETKMRRIIILDLKP